MIIRPETPQDYPAIFTLHHQAFGQDGEARLVDALRAEGYVRAAFVAERAGEIVGHILFSRLLIHTDNGPIEALALAPMAVMPTLQRQGIGSVLITEALRACQQEGHRIVVVLGHPEFYPRFGFSHTLAIPLQSPYAHGAAWMALELQPGALTNVRGRVQYAAPFAAFE